MSLGHVQVKVPTKSQLVVDIDHLLIPSASTILHLLPGKRHGKAKAGTYTLGQLHDMSGSDIFQVVASVSHLKLDTESNISPVRNIEFIWYHTLIIIYFQTNTQQVAEPSMVKNPGSFQMGVGSIQEIQDDDVDTTEVDSDISDPEDNSNMLKMFEAYSAANSKQKGLYLKLSIFFHALNILGKCTVDAVESHALAKLKNIVESPPDSQEEYT